MVKALLLILRPVNVLLTMLAVYVGGVISFDKYYDPNLLLAIISSAAIAGFGHVVNDVFDIEIDRKSKPHRMLPSGELKQHEAIIWAMVLAACGIIVAGLINNLCLILASSAAILLLAHTPALKNSSYWGNLIIAFVASLVFFYGAAAVGNETGGFIPAAYAFLFHFAREIVKDIEGAEIDRELGIMTGVVKHGEKHARMLAIFVMVALFFATFIPYMLNIYGVGYLIAIVVGTDIFILYFIIKLLKPSTPGVCSFISGCMKVIMPLGIIAVFLGSRGL